MLPNNNSSILLHFKQEVHLIKTMMTKVMLTLLLILSVIQLPTNSSATGDNTTDNNGNLHDSSNWTGEYNRTSTDDRELDLSGLLSQDGHVIFKSGNLDEDDRGAMFPKTILPLIIIIVGLLGNALILVVVCGRRGQKNAFMTCLGTLAVTDTVLIGYFLTMWVSFNYSSIYKIVILSMAGCKLNYFMTYMFGHCSAWMLVAINIERMICTNLPHKAMIFNSRRSGIYIAFGVLCLACCTDMHYLIGVKVILRTLHNVTIIKCTSDDADSYYFVKNTWPWMHYILHSVIPSVAILICNVMTVRAVFKSGKFRKTSPSADQGQKKNRHLMTITLLVSAAFLITTTPYSLMSATKLLSPKYVTVETYLALAALLLSNHSINIFLYVLSGERFRQDLKASLTQSLTDGFSHHYQLGESTFIFRGVRNDFYFLSHFSMKILKANRIAPDGTPRSAASHLGLFCLPMSHKRDVRLK